MVQQKLKSSLFFDLSNKCYMDAADAARKKD